MKTTDGVKIVEKYTHEQQTEILKFLAQYPFEEIDFGENRVSQIIKIDYAAQEITLRNYFEYTVETIVESKGFRDKEINKKWQLFLKKFD